MKCPHDNVDLVMADRQGIEIDYCPTCRGVWLDRGELDKIVERSAAELAAATPVAAPAPVAAPQPYAPRAEYGHGGNRPRHDDRYAGGHRRKSFLQDLFD